MAPESCNLGKDEAEILKTSSASSSPSSSPQNPVPQAQPAAQPPPSCLLLKPSLDFFTHKSEMAEIAVKASSSSLPKPEEKSRPPVLFGHRCSTCRKRLGLTGFRCRCGQLFCAQHRYSDRHVCSFDYKAAGREEISKANPLIRAAKIIKI